MKKFLVTVLVLLLIAFATIFVMGYRLPASHTVSRTVVLSAPPERVYSIVSNVTAEPKWRPSVKSVTILPNIGDHMQWSENSSIGDVPMELVTDNPPLERVVEISDPKLPFQGMWTYDFAPQGSGTQLIITEHGRVPNPLWRFISHYVMGETKTIDEYQADLQRAVAQPQP